MLTKQSKNEDANRVLLHKPITHKRNKAVQFLLLPEVVFMWIVGWSLYWTGSKKGQIKPRKSVSVGELVLTVRMPEKKIAT